MKLYYTKNYNKIAEEEIYSLDYLTTNNFTYQNPIYTYYFNFKSLDKNLYKFYLYINYDDNEKFLYEFQVDLNLIDSSPLYKYNSSTNIYTPTDSTPVENYRFYLKIDNKVKDSMVVENQSWYSGAFFEGHLMLVDGNLCDYRDSWVCYPRQGILKIGFHAENGIILSF